MPGGQRNNALVQLLEEAQLSYAAFAAAIRRIATEHGRAINADKSNVSHWVSGTVPVRRTIDFMAEALSRRLNRVVHPSDMGYGHRPTPTPDPAVRPGEAVRDLGRTDRRQVLRGGVYSVAALATALTYQPGPARADAGGRGRIGMTEVDAVRDITAAFNRADEKLGGGFGRSAVVEYLTTDVAAYLDAAATEPVRRAMFGAAAQLAYLAGWKAHDVGLEDLSQRHYLLAYRLACESDQAHAGYVLRILAHQAFDLGHKAHCVELAQAALAANQGRVSTETESLYWLTLARAHAAEHNRRESLAALLHAETLINRATPDEAPAWASLGGPPQARLASQAGHTFAALGDLAEAEKAFKRSASCWDPVTHQRIYALTLADQASVQCRRGHVEQACATWATALTGMEGVKSSRTADAIKEMRRQLAPFHKRGVRAVAALEHRARELADPAA